MASKAPVSRVISKVLETPGSSSEQVMYLEVGFGVEPYLPRLTPNSLSGPLPIAPGAIGPGLLQGGKEGKKERIFLF